MRFLHRFQTSSISENGYFTFKNVHRNLALMILTATQSHQETSNVIAEMDFGEPVVKMVHV